MHGASSRTWVPVRPSKHQLHGLLKRDHLLSPIHLTERLSGLENGHWVSTGFVNLMVSVIQLIQNSEEKARKDIITKDWPEAKVDTGDTAVPKRMRFLSGSGVSVALVFVSTKPDWKVENYVCVWVKSGHSWACLGPQFNISKERAHLQRGAAIQSGARLSRGDLLCSRADAQKQSTQ
uniref:Uncharacterized protein n=1 Tax=Rangifer tarandus platyrhynchus TaxID=3082113 RepID=A0ACB0FJ95_RANTA|nr:unnamed protein product [Rangifer tarandus platyrhynchus]